MSNIIYNSYWNECTSTSRRILNALRVYTDPNTYSGGEFAPLFKSRFLNCAIFVKANFMPPDTAMADQNKSVPTKILFPIDIQNLRSGSRYLYIGQQNWEQTISNQFGISRTEYADDFRKLILLHEIPTFDPFLVKEWFKQSGYDISDCYAQISTTEASQMEAFVARELADLVNKASIENESVLRMARKLLDNDGTDNLGPLRDILGLTDGQLRDGIFGWKGVLYYKWSSENILKETLSTINDLRNFVPSRRSQPELNKELTLQIKYLGRQMVYLIYGIKNQVESYNASFQNFKSGTGSKDFRNFILSARATFISLGVNIGIVTHINSSWHLGRQFPGVRDRAQEFLLPMLNDWVRNIDAVSKDNAHMI